MKRLLLFLSLILTVALITPIATYAHILATDGTIGAVLHIDPDDDPIIGQQASFFFEFKDQTGKFDPKNCTCTFSISENGKQIYSQDLFQNNINPSLDNSSVFYTFPEKNVYTVKVTGQPIDHEFKPFTLSWDLRITRTSEQQTSSSPSVSPLIVITGGIVIGIIIVGGLYFLTNKTARKNKE